MVADMFKSRKKKTSSGSRLGVREVVVMAAALNEKSASGLHSDAREVEEAVEATRRGALADGQ